MNRILGAIKATYNFFSGDAITLAATLIAFALSLFIARVLQAPQALVAAVFIIILVAGLITTLSREIAGRPRARS
jgi:cobalamin biosynthesis protein CobD/CbiB